MNDLVPPQYFSSSNQVSSSVSRTLKYGMTKLSENLDNFALHDTNTRNCIEFIRNGDLNKVEKLEIAPSAINICSELSGG